MVFANFAYLKATAMYAGKITCKTLLALLVAIVLLTAAWEMYSVYNNQPELRILTETEHSRSSPIEDPSRRSPLAQALPQRWLRNPFANASQLTAEDSTARQATNGTSRHDLASKFRGVFKKRVPERLAISEGTNIHFSVRTGQTNHELRLPLLFLTWFQTVPPQNVNQFHTLVMKIMMSGILHTSYRCSSYDLRTCFTIF